MKKRRHFKTRTLPLRSCRVRKSLENYALTPIEPSDTETDSDTDSGDSGGSTSDWECKETRRKVYLDRYKIPWTECDFKGHYLIDFLNVFIGGSVQLQYQRNVKPYMFPSSSIYMIHRKVRIPVFRITHISIHKHTNFLDVSARIHDFLPFIFDELLEHRLLPELTALIVSYGIPNWSNQIWDLILQYPLSFVQKTIHNQTCSNQYTQPSQ
jgi:hypothetical protein